MIDPRMLRDHPDRIRAAQTKRGLSPAAVDEALAADERRRTAIVEFERLRGGAEGARQADPRRQGEEKQQLLARTKTLSGEVKTAEAAQGEADAAYRAALMAIPNPAAETAPAGGEDDYVRARAGRGSRATSRPRASSRATTSSSARSSARSTSTAAPRCRAPGSTT